MFEDKLYFQVFVNITQSGAQPEEKIRGKGKKKGKEITLEEKRRKRASEEKRGKDDKEENEEILNWGKDGLVLDSQNKKTEIIQGVLPNGVISYPFKI